MLYIRICFDRKDALGMRDRVLKSHREYIAEHLSGKNSVKVVQGGPMCEADDLADNVGSFLIIDAPSLQEAKRFHDEDPFTVAGLFDRTDVIRWDRHIGNPGRAEYVP